MRRIEPGQPPQSHRTRRALHETYPAFSSDPAIRKALWERQGGVCAYCERRLRNPDELDHRTRIEHFHPQHTTIWGGDCSRSSGATDQGDSTTHWHNLLLCCDGFESAGREFTCDKAKGNTDICAQFRNPTQWAPPRLLDVGRDGRATPVDGLPSDAPTVINDVLRLNERHLVAVRKQLISSFVQRINVAKRRSRGLTSNQRADLATKLRSKAAEPGQEYPSTLLSMADRLAP